MKEYITIKFFLLVFFSILNSTLTAQQIDYKGFPQWSWHKEGVTEYYLYTPSDLATDKKYPVAIFLHGCCGQDDHATLRNAVDPPARLWHNFGQNTQIEPTYIIAPKTTRGWKQKFPDIKKVVDDLISGGNADSQRIYMTGFSMGGGGIYQFIEEYPGYIAAAVPMGMSMRVEPQIIKDVPVWAIRGELDYYCKTLPEEVGAVRALNGDDRGGLDWVTGVNPRFSSFKGIGHGVQWDAVSNLDLLSWMYSKVNDGNLYPNVFFEEPGYLHPYHPGQTAEIKINASDPDGSIEKIELYFNDQLINTLTRKPYEDQHAIGKGISNIKAIAYDERGKSSVAEITVMGICLPEFETTGIPDAIQGNLYLTTLIARGNGPFNFDIDPSSELPGGVILNKNGILSGIPEKSGHYSFKVIAEDLNTRKVECTFNLKIKPKNKDEIVITNVHSTADSLEFNVDKMRIGALPNMQAGTEVSFSDIGEYEGLTYISTSQLSKESNNQEVLFFTVDEDVTVLVAYEVHDNIYESSIPPWLSDFDKLEGEQIVAQYFYFDIYRKDFQSGQIILPGADALSNGVLRNYFVMVKKKS